MSNKGTFTIGTINAFYEKWDSFHEGEYIKMLCRKINEEKVKKVVFFVHGYNVPYSLAVTQLITLKNEMKEKLNIKPSEILFIPIFWSSNDFKNVNLTDSIQFDNSNFTGLFNGGLENGLLYTYYSNRCYYASITLRKILNKIDTRKEVILFSHSLGATIVTSSLINTIQKLDTKSNPRVQKNQECKATFLNADSVKLFDQEVTYEIVKGWCDEPIPTQKLKIFMSAPAIPGKITFSDIDSVCFLNKTFYSTINLNDEMLTKHIAKVFFVKKSNFSASSLGCDITEAHYAELEIEKYKSLASKFNYAIVGWEEDHDILTYFNDNKYIEFLSQFLNEK